MNPLPSSVKDNLRRNIQSLKVASEWPDNQQTADYLVDLRPGAFVYIRYSGQWPPGVWRVMECIVAAMPPKTFKGTVHFRLERKGGGTKCWRPASMIYGDRENARKDR